MKMKIFSVFFIFALIIAVIWQPAIAGWQTHKKHWPRLIYEKSDLPIIRAHYEAAQQGVEPYKTLWDRIQKMASKSPAIGKKEWSQQNINGNISKAKALLYTLTADKKQADQARDILAGMYRGKKIPPYGIIFNPFKYKLYKNLERSVMKSIHIAQSLTLHCQAYDMLKGAGYNFGVNYESKIKKNLAALAAMLYDMSNWISGGSKVVEFVNIYSDDVEEKNNFQLKITSALGLAAICLNGHKNAEKWMNRAMTKFWQVFNAQTTLQGGYGEGPFYFLYSALNFLPLFRAYNLFMDGQGGNFDDHKIPNFLGSDRVAKVFDWGMRIRMPNGDRPGYDDGYYVAFPTGLLVSSPNMSGHATDHHPDANLSVYVWDWTRTVTMTDGYDNRYFSGFANLDLTVDLFCVFDANVEPQKPSGSPTQFFAEAGNVVFRSDWDSGAIYLHLLGEKGNMRLIGGAHEHPDAGSFVIFAHNELLALDAGYPGFKQHDKVNKAKNHNVILVNGEGPTTDSELGEFFDTALLDFASVKMSYANANIQRNFLFVDNRYFVLIDQIESNRSHEYTWLLHGNAGAGLANTSFSQIERGGVWKRHKASLEAYVISDRGNPTYEVGTDYHSIQFVGTRELPRHSVLRVRQTADNLCYIGVLMPIKAGISSPGIGTLATTGGACIRIDEQDGTQAFGIVRGESDLATLKTQIPHVGEIETDGVITFIHFSAQSDQPKHLFVKNAKSVKVGKRQFLSANHKCSIALAYDDSKKEFVGQLQGHDNILLSLKLPVKQPKVTGAKKFSYKTDSQILQLEFDKPGSFRIKSKN